MLNKLSSPAHNVAALSTFSSSHSMIIIYTPCDPPFGPVDHRWSCDILRANSTRRLFSYTSLSLPAWTIPSYPRLPAKERAMSPSKKHVDIIDTDAGEGSSSAATPSTSAVATPRDVLIAKRPLQSSYKLPSSVRFFLVATISFAISSMGYSFINEFTKGELATVMRTLETEKEIAVMIAWRLTELAIGWFANFDSVDLAALNLLSHSPTVWPTKFSSIVFFYCCEH